MSRRLLASGLVKGSEIHFFPLYLRAVRTGGERLIFYFLIGEEIEETFDILFTVILKDIEVGKAVRPQLASRASNAIGAWKKVSLN